jgi:hypothetical protein
MVVLAIDHSVKGLVSALFDGSGRAKTRVNWVTELCNYNEVAERGGDRLALAGGIFTKQLCDPLSPFPRDPEHGPSAPIPIQLVAKDDLIAESDLPIRELDRLGNMSLKVKTERSATT